MAVQVTSPRLDSLSRTDRPVALVQVTDLGVHARVGRGGRSRVGDRRRATGAARRARP